MSRAPHSVRDLRPRGVELDPDDVDPRDHDRVDTRVAKGEDTVHQHPIAAPRLRLGRDDLTKTLHGVLALLDRIIA